jgi:DNA-binding SARP family transcriptional activator
MRLFLLGPVRALTDHRWVRLGGTKPQTVLAALLLYGRSGISVDRLTRLLWSGDPPRTVSAQIHTYVSRLRMKLGPVIGIDLRHGRYVLRPDDPGAVWLDLQEFSKLIKQATFEVDQRRIDRAADALHAALALWQIPVLDNVTSALVEAAEPVLDEIMMSALEARIAVDLYLNRHAALLPQLRHLVKVHPYRETLRAQLMAALFYCDRKADALAVFRDGRQLLVDELGVDPGKALSQAHVAVLRDHFPLRLPVHLDLISQELAAAFAAHFDTSANLNWHGHNGEDVNAGHRALDRRDNRRPSSPLVLARSVPNPAAI